MLQEACSYPEFCANLGAWPHASTHQAWRRAACPLLGSPLRKGICFLPVQQAAGFATSFTLPLVPRTVCKQSQVCIHCNVCLHAEVPLVAFLALVRLGVTPAALVLGRTRCCNQRGIHHGARLLLQSLGLQQRIDRGQVCSASLWRSRRCLKRRMLDSLGMCSPQWDRLAKSRKAVMSCKAPSTAGSLSLNHCCMRWMRSSVCTAKGCWSRRPLSGT